MFDQLYKHVPTIVKYSLIRHWTKIVPASPGFEMFKCLTLVLCKFNGIAAR